MIVFICKNPQKMKTTLSNLCDSELQQYVKEGNKQAFEVIFDRYWKRLFAYAFKIFNDEKIAEDIVQEIFISLWEKSNDANILNLEAYLVKSVKYKIANHIRDLKFSPVHIEILHNIPNTFKTEKDLEYKEFEKDIFNEIKKLPPKCQEVFMLSRFEDYSSAEIAEQLDISVRTVEKHISNALKHLKATIGTYHLAVLITGMFL
ncbi:MAG: RNA polymerase sigma-70 factor (family 1) [Flavobacteriales bacterium]|jgi:RNA polymerase sigma-70 factor (family 1)